MLLLEQLHLCASVLSDACRLEPFLCQVAGLFSHSLLSSSQQAPLLRACLRGLRQSFSAESLSAAAKQSLRGGVAVVHRAVCEGVERALLLPVSASLLAFLQDTAVWKEMAGCLAVSSLRLDSFTEFDPVVSACILITSRPLSSALPWLAAGGEWSDSSGVGSLLLSGEAL